MFQITLHSPEGGMIVKKSLISGFVLCLVLLSGCAEVQKLPASSPSSAEAAPSMTASSLFFAEDPQQKLTLATTADYVLMTPQQVSSKADLVVLGQFVKNLGSWVEENGRVYTKGMVRVTNILKGELREREIEVVFNGGVVPLSDYLGSLDEASVKKMGILPQDITDGDTVFDHFGPYQANPALNQPYLFLLNAMEKENTWFLGSDVLSMLSVKDEQYFDKLTKSWSPVRDLFQP